MYHAISVYLLLFIHFHRKIMALSFNYSSDGSCVGKFSSKAVYHVSSELIALILVVRKKYTHLNGLSKKSKGKEDLGDG